MGREAPPAALLRSSLFGLPILALVDEFPLALARPPGARSFTWVELAAGRCQRSRVAKHGNPGQTKNLVDRLTYQGLDHAASPHAACDQTRAKATKVQMKRSISDAGRDSLPGTLAFDIGGCAGQSR